MPPVTALHVPSQEKRAADLRREHARLAKDGPGSERMGRSLGPSLGYRL